MICSVIHCPSLPRKDLSFFNFPEQNKAEYSKWIRFCGRADNWKFNKDSQICELHFKDADKVGVPFLKVLKDRAVPKILIASAEEEFTGGIRSINEDSCRICLTDDLNADLMSLTIKHNGIFIWEMLEYATTIQV